MREAIRCCISCILPCGALDVVRIVHASGRVEEISHAVRAGEVMQAYPKHVLRKPPSANPHEWGGGDGDGPGRGATILPPTAELQKGKIYFLMPVSSAPDKARPAPAAAASAKRRRKKREPSAQGPNDTARLLLSDQYLSEILSEKASTQRERRRGRVGVWRPHLESISEVTNDF
uniref:Histone-lysine N-methyltransferase SETDB1-B n=1 Tax=Anthurium amnicola TaxID=1678845 RepID=A0A1D1XQQ5_9ARAE